jgi:murein DD-endopeptidase MepM/ murein hydrolase activator NlpD
MDNEVIFVPRYFIRLLACLKKYIFSREERIRLPQVRETLDPSIIYLALAALMMAVSASMLMYGAVKDYRLAVAKQQQLAQGVQESMAKPAAMEEKERASVGANNLGLKRELPLSISIAGEGIKMTTEATGVQGRQEELLVQPLQGNIIVTYGWREHPIYKDWRFHSGINIQAAKGQVVKAALSGQVVEVQQNRENIRVKVSSQHGFTVVYDNLQESFVQAGQSITQGQKVGFVGENPLEQEYGLHFEIWKDNRSIDPVNLFKK